MKSHYKYWFASALLVFSLSACGGGGGGGTPPQTHDVWTSITSSGAPSARDSHTAVWTGSTGTTNANRMVVWGGLGLTADLNDGGIYNPALNTWSSISTANTPTARDSHTAVLVGDKMVVWGGIDQSNNPLDTGGVYDTINNVWSATTTTGAPSPRFAHTAISAVTGTWNLMIVWGGDNVTTPPTIFSFNDGGVYDVINDTWTSATGTTNSLYTKKAFHTAVWTGETGTTNANRMIVWGGYDSGSSTGDVNTGAIYDPINNIWTSVTSSTSSTPSARDSHTAVWTGKEMIVWGGISGLVDVNTGCRYNPVTDTWETISTIGAPTERDSHTAIWTGNEMIIWGGEDQNGITLGDGARYNPATDSWAPVSMAGAAPSAREYHSAVWTGTEMIIWGGAYSQLTSSSTGTIINYIPVDDGAIYHP